jgi:protocatechuate 3,4-dioxygenase beta subunit
MTRYSKPHNDVHQTGCIMSRREALALLGTAGFAMLAGGSSWSSAAERALACVASPEQTEGPYFVDERLNRSDIRTDPADGSMRDGVPLILKLAISSVAGSKCAPLAGAAVDLWHCDAAGIYSDANDPGFNTRGRKFLRGYQVTDADGSVRFTTVYPGWYDGRTVHIHFKVRGTAGAKRGYEFTSQLYFDDAFTDRVFTRGPYARRGKRSVRNGGDGIFRDGGSRMILPVTQSDAGYAANFNVGLRLA